jgi:hypothetical protein
MVISCGGAAAPPIANHHTATTEPARVVDTRFAMKVVDSGSADMQRIFEHVGAGAGSITRETERWQDEAGGRAVVSSRVFSFEGSLAAAATLVARFRR